MPYSFLSIWELEAPIDRVWDAVRAADSYPAWFPAVQRVELLQPGDGRGVGTLTRSWWSTALPYSFVFDSRTARIEAPSLIELASTGDLVGTGRWELSEHDGRTTVRYFWDVQPAKRWMNLLAPLARPAFTWNHAVVMQAGGTGLARHLDVPLRSNQSYTAGSTNPVWALASTLGMLALTALLLGRIRRAVDRLV